MTIKQYPTLNLILLLHTPFWKGGPFVRARSRMNARVRALTLNLALAQFFRRFKGSLAPAPVRAFELPASPGKTPPGC